MQEQMIKVKEALITEMQQEINFYDSCKDMSKEDVK